MQENKIVSNLMVVGIISQMLAFLPLVYLIFHILDMGGIEGIPVLQSAILLAVLATADVIVRKLCDNA